MSLSPKAATSSTKPAGALETLQEENIDGEVVLGAPFANIRSSPPVAIPNGDSTRLGSGDGGFEEKGRDSEAETIVLDGKDGDATKKAKRVIKHEDQSETGNRTREDVEMKDAPGIAVEDIAVAENEPSDLLTVKRKRVAKEGKKDGANHEAGNSSGLSSVPTSPATKTHSSRRAASESDDSRSSPPHPSSKGRPRGPPKSRKRKLGESDSEDDGSHVDSRKVSGAEVPGFKERRETRSATVRSGSPGKHDHRGSEERSISPRIRSHRRAVSSQSTPHLSNGSIPKKRKLPPPPVSIREAKISDDVQSDSSSTNGSPRPSAHLKKAYSGDVSTLSPAKMPVHRKLRDQIGRTFLARACAKNDIETAQTCLTERPQDIDVPDHAGNTPLQLAALEGFPEIVELLIQAGADVHCKNNDKDTPLTDAVENGHLEVVNLLLKAGADPRQSNAKGEEPLDLLDPDKEMYTEIRDALREAMKRDTERRRHSEDQSGNPSISMKENGQSSRGASAASPRNSPTTLPSRSPPLFGQGTRRRNARGETTPNDLLWVDPKKEINDRASRGDLHGVSHILNMNPRAANADTLIAAAKGGHEEVMQIVLALGGTDADPDPRKSGDITPMLVVIGKGKGSVEIIRLLLQQANFDPTRTDKHGRTYYEIAKQRQGQNWEDEYKILKASYDNYGGKRKARSNNGPKGSSPESVRNSREKDRDAKRSARADPSSPSQKKEVRTHKTPSSGASSPKLEHRSKEKRHPKDGHSSSKDGGIRNGYSKLQSHSQGSREPSVAVSDKELPNIERPESKKTRTQSDVTADKTKPRRKLVSGKVMRNDHDTVRRPSSLSGSDGESKDEKHRLKNKVLKRESVSLTEESKAIRSLLESKQGGTASDPTISKSSDTSKLKKRRSSKDRSATVKDEVASKRTRESTSPRPSNPKPSDSKKRRRLDPEVSKVTDKTLSTSKGERVKDKSVKPRLSRSSSEMENQPWKMSAPGHDPDGKLKQKSTSRTNETTPIRPHGVAKESDAQLKKKHRTSSTLAEDNNLQKQLKAEHDDQLKREQAEVEAAKAMAEKEQREKAEQEKARYEARIAQETAERNAHIEREREIAAEEKRRAEEAERIRLAKEAEEARIEKKRREEEAQRVREEKRREQEERVRQAMLKQKEEAERVRRQALPQKLCMALEKTAAERKSWAWAKSFLPFYAAVRHHFDAQCPPDRRDEKWIANFQVAAVLGEEDMSLPHRECGLILLPGRKLTRIDFSYCVAKNPFHSS